MQEMWLINDHSIINPITGPVIALVSKRLCGLCHERVAISADSHWFFLMQLRLRAKNNAAPPRCLGSYQLQNVVILKIVFCVIFFYLFRILKMLKR
jgi:hypothetical protein